MARKHVSERTGGSAHGPRRVSTRAAGDGDGWREKLSPTMRALWDDWTSEGAELVGSRDRMFRVLAATGPEKPARSVCFVYCTPKAKLSGLAAAGVRLNQSSGRVRTGVVPFEALPALCADADVVRVRPSRILQTKMDVAGPAVHVPALRAKAGGLDGKGVVVGIVDSGIDASHPAFAGRVHSIWDQTISGPGVAEGGYGLELQGALLAASRDTSGHGTHCAGIAAGADPTYGGVAPAATLVIVKTTMSDANIADGVRYVFRVAKSLGRPAVVNLSLGGHFDAHDGSDALSASLDAETGPGRIVCCAAGNEGDDAIHATLQVPAGGTSRATVRVAHARGVLLNGWYPGGSPLEVAVEGPSGLVTPFQGPVPAVPGVVKITTPDGQVRISGGNVDPDNGDRQVLVEVSPNSGATMGVWALIVRNPAAAAVRFDAWLLARPDDAASAFGPQATDDLKVGSPGAAASAITVASYTTRVSWTDVDGKTRAVPLTPDSISGFSSEGPLRNGQRKPDVAAPGAVIASALSRDSSASRPWLLDAEHRMMMGTSMATPFVTGLVALLLQRTPTLTPQAAKQQLAAAAAVPGLSKGTWDPKWGYGVVDAALL